MSEFDPKPAKVAEPEYLRYFRPIETPEPDTSKAKAIKATGDVAEEAIKSADTVEKIDKENQGYQLGQQESEDFLTAVNVTKDSLTGKPAPEGVPDDIKKGLSSISNLQNAKGQMTELEYRKNLYTKAKDLRTANPGYRDYIDKGVEKATGITPNANQYISALIANINKGLEQKNEYKNKILTKALDANEQGAPGMPDYISSWHRGDLSDDQMLSKLNASMAFKYTSATNEARLKIFEGDRKMEEARAQDYVVPYVSERTQKTLDGIMVNLGLTGQKLTDAMAKHAKGEQVDIGDDQWTHAGQLIDNEILQSQRLYDAHFSNVKFASGRSVQQALGDKYHSVVDNNLFQLKQVKQAITDKDLGLMFTNKNIAEGMMHGDLFKALQDPSTGPILRLAGAANKAGGNQFAATMFTAIFGAQDPVSKESLRALTNNMITGHNYHGISGINKAFDIAAEEGKPKDAMFVATAPAGAIAFPGITDEAKINSAKYTFKPGEEKLFDKIEMDGKTLDGQPIKGRYSVYSEYAKPVVVQEMRRLANTYGQEHWDNYKAWMENSFSKSLFGREMHELNDVSMSPGLSIRAIDNGKDSPRFAIDYKGQNEVNLKNIDGLQIPALERERLKFLSASINRLNGGVKSLHSVYSQTGDNVNANLMKYLGESGAPVPEDEAKVPGAMMAAIAALRKPKELGRKE